MSKSQKSTSTLIHMTNWQKTISTEDKLNAIRQLEKGEQSVDINRNVTLSNTSILTMGDYSGGIKKAYVSN